jgi:hypothetical protein
MPGGFWQDGISKEFGLQEIRPIGQHQYHRQRRPEMYGWCEDIGLEISLTSSTYFPRGITTIRLMQLVVQLQN